MNYIFRNYPIYIARPALLMECMSVDAVFNVYLEIKMHFKSFRKDYIQDNIDWIESHYKHITE